MTTLLDALPDTAPAAPQLRELSLDRADWLGRERELEIT